MRKLIVYSSLIIVNCLILLPITYYQLPIAYAAESTPAADLKEKLSQLQKDIASKAAKLKQEINQKLQNKAYVGLVKSSSATSLTLANDHGAKIVSLNQDSEFSSHHKKVIRYSLKTLKEDDFVAALGDVDENGVLTARKIILWPTPPPEAKIHLWGQVISLSDNLITLTTKDGKSVTVSVTSETNLEKDGKEVSLAQVLKNNFVIVTGVMGEEETLLADFIYLYSQPAFLKPKKIATPSAQASSSASPSLFKGKSP